MKSEVLKKNILFLSFLSALSGTLFAQNIKGKIQDGHTGEEIIGAAVILKEDQKKVVISGLDGTFVISLPQRPCTLICRYIGYETVEILVDETDTQLIVGMEPSSVMLHEVMVTGFANRGSEQTGIAFKKNAMNVVEVVSAKAMELSPDLNVANVLQRVPSVSLERTSGGQAQYAIIRGMDKRYSYTLVNGIKIPSPDNRFRYVPMDLFPSDLLDRLVVTKALTPDMEGDAIGGAMDMLIKDAPGQLTVNVNASAGYSTLFFDRDFVTFDASAINYRSPKELNPELYLVGKDDFSTGNVMFENRQAPLNLAFGLSVGDRFFNKKLGVMVAGSFQNTHFGNNSTFISTSVNKSDNQPFVSNVTWREYSTSERRMGWSAKADYTLNKNHKIDLCLLAVDLFKQEFRNAIDQNKELANRIEVWKRSRINHQRILNGTISGTHWIDERKQLKLNWTFAISKAMQDNPDQANLKLAQDEMEFVENPTLRWMLNSSRRWEKNDDSDLTGLLRAEYTLRTGGSTLTGTVGAMYRDKKRTNYYNIYTFDPALASQLYTGWANAALDVRNPLGVLQNPLNYAADETVAAGFAMLRWTAGDWDVLGGVRYEQTKMNWETDAPDNSYGKTGWRSYFDILPSVNVRYALAPKQNLRLAYFASIGRPGFFEVIPYILPGDEYDEGGNPFLKRVQADNIDFRYEIFLGSLDFFTAGIFFKSIRNPIELSLEKSELKPANFGNAQNMGFEVEVTKYFRNIGLKANYSYTDSRITTTKTLWGRSNREDQTSELTAVKVDQMRPLQGQSQHIANVSILYKDGKRGFDVQLAGIFTGRRIAMVSPYYERDLWQRDMFQLDFSAEKRLYMGLLAYIKLGNLLDTPYTLEVKGNAMQSNIPLQDKQGRVTVRRDIFGRTFLVGVRYRIN